MKKLLILVLLLSSQACANDNKRETEENQVKGKEMTRAEIFGEKPIYKLRVHMTNNTSDIAIKAKVNGVKVYENFANSKAFGLMTVNDFISNKNNTIGMMLMAKSQNISSQAKAKVTLEVFAEGKHYILNSLVLDMSKEDKTEGSTEIGVYSYDSKKGLVSDLDGQIKVGGVSVEKFNLYRRGKVTGLNVTQTFSLPTPYPKWKFLDSQNIIETTYDYMNKEEHEKLKKTPKIQALYTLDAKIRKALKDKNPQSIIDLFDERLKEKAIAVYEPFSTLKPDFLEFISKDVNDVDNELVEYSKDEHYFVIEENKKLAWLRPIEYYNKVTKLYSIYRIKYRLNKEEKWVITK